MKVGDNKGQTEGSIKDVQPLVRKKTIESKRKKSGRNEENEMMKRR